MNTPRENPVRPLMQIVRGMQEDEMNYWINECFRNQKNYSIRPGMPDPVQELCLGIDEGAFTDDEVWMQIRRDLKTYFGY